MAVTRISQSSLKQGLKKNKNFVAGIPPETGALESIATVTVGSGGASSITFSDIPGGFQHLQVRGVYRSTAADTNGEVRLRVNSDTGNNYATHTVHVISTQTNITTTALSSNSYALAGIRSTTAANQTASVFGANVLDILDYSSSSKNKTSRSFGGYDANGTGTAELVSGLWMSTSAITSLLLYPSAGNWAQHTTVALYGVRA